MLERVESIGLGELLDDRRALLRPAQVARLPPGRLLHRAWWEHAAVVLGLGGKKVAESDQLAAMRMIDYVQSVIAAIKPENYTNDVSEEDWNKLKAD